MKNRVNLLIKLLIDMTASVSERDDAAMDLADFSEDSAVDALLSVAENINEDPIILNSCGESLGAIWVRKNLFNEKDFYRISGIARYGVYFVLRARKPEWVKNYQLEMDKFQD